MILVKIEVPTADAIKIVILEVATVDGFRLRSWLCLGFAGSALASGVV